MTLEDIAILETTDYDTPLDLSKEQHMATDKPGILMRHKLAALQWVNRIAGVIIMAFGLVALFSFYM